MAVITTARTEVGIVIEEATPAKPLHRVEMVESITPTAMRLAELVQPPSIAVSPVMDLISTEMVTAKRVSDPQLWLWNELQPFSFIQKKVDSRL